MRCNAIQILRATQCPAHGLLVEGVEAALEDAVARLHVLREHAVLQQVVEIRVHALDLLRQLQLDLRTPIDANIGPISSDSTRSHSDSDVFCSTNETIKKQSIRSSNVTCGFFVLPQWNSEIA